MLLCFLRILDPSVFAMLYTKLLLNLWLIESNLTCLTKYTCHSQLSFLVGISLLTLSQLRKSLILLVSLHGKTKGFLLKIDLAKAFDRIEWSFITSALSRNGFPSHVVTWIKSCISTPEFSVLVNGQPSTSFLSQR